MPAQSRRRLRSAAAAPFDSDPEVRYPGRTGRRTVDAGRLRLVRAGWGMV